MKRITLLLSAIFIFLNAESQDYSAIIPGQIVFFNSANQSFNVSQTYSPIKALRFDSSETVTNGIIFYNFNTYRDTDFSSGQALACIYVDAPSWIGCKVFCRADSMQMFYNFWDDSIFIKTNAQLNETWHLYYFADTAFIDATLDSIIFMNMNGINDSVKIISLHANDTMGNSIQSPFNGKEIWLSKTHGFLKTYSFINFPYDATEINMYPNFLLPTNAQLYDFNIGDEFQYSGYCQGPWSNPSPYADTYKYLNKYYSAALDTVFYEVNHIHVTYTFPQMVPTYSSDTGILAYTNLNAVNAFLPEENILDTVQGVSVYRSMVDSSMYFGRTQFSTVFGNIKFWLPDTCVMVNHFEPEYDVYTSAAGIGMVFSSSDQTPSLGSFCQEQLFYYKKGSEVFGTPGAWTSAIESETPVTLSVTPNPATNNMVIKSGNFELKEFFIYNQNGQLVKSIATYQKSLSVDVSDLNNGLYIIVTKSKSELLRCKFLVAR